MNANVYYWDAFDWDTNVQDAMVLSLKLSSLLGRWEIVADKDLLGTASNHTKLD